MKGLAFALLMIGIGWPSPADSQSLTAEADITAGYSSDEVAALATQLRAFGDLKAGVRYYL